MPQKAAAQASNRNPKVLHPNAHKCSKCGMNVAGGWGHFNHNKICTFAKFKTPARCTTTTTVVTTPVVMEAQHARDDDNLNAGLPKELDCCYAIEDEQLEEDTPSALNTLAAEVRISCILTQLRFATHHRVLALGSQCEIQNFGHNT